MDIGGSGAGEPLSQINVTPLVDVMLVMLIIFMIAAPMLVQGVNVNLPEATAKALDTKNERLVVSLTKEEKIYLDTVEVSRENLTEKALAVLEQRTDDQVYLRADAEVSYGFVVEIMAALKAAGVERVGMVTEPMSPKSKVEERVD
ncbi:MAG: protein TolR [Deltaproteobacteria bacterium]|nr:protein TolR [Deltaproteobacteria bacterium]